MGRTTARTRQLEVLDLPSAPELIELGRSLSRAGREVGLLETRGMPGPSILAWDPAATLAVEHGELTIRDPHALLPAPPNPNASGVPGLLQATLDRFGRQADSAPAGPPGLPFVGGFLGFVGYEWAVGQEGPKRSTETGMPELWFGLFDRAVVAGPVGPPRLVVDPSMRGTHAREVAKELRALGRDTGPTSAPTPQVPRVTSDLSRAEFGRAVGSVRRSIRQGEVYQVDIARRVRMEGLGGWDLYDRLRQVNPSPFGGVLATRGFTVVSGSPEELVRVQGNDEGARTISTRPIAGTRPRAAGRQDLLNERALRSSVKEVAEHTMIVDLERNDLGRVCSFGSVEVDEWLTVERYSHVMHLVSNVRGRLRDDAQVPEVFRALMPGGSITGTPKIRATEVIAEVERVPRAAYTGSLGHLSLDGQMSFNLLIRSAFFPRGAPEAYLYAGAGIVQDSQADREWREVERKMSALLESLDPRQPRSSGFPWAPPRRTQAWVPPRPTRQFPGRRVLIIDNYDSFTYNLAQYLGVLGAEVRVLRNDEASLKELHAWRPSHVVLSPGPGSPSEAGITLDAVRSFEGTPLLGVCLGHEALIEAYGGQVGLARRPFHGKTSVIRRRTRPPPSDLLAEMPTTFQGARYHSLVARSVPPELAVAARTLEGEVMAVQHRSFPSFGVQFHPESIRTQGGMSILSRFLAVQGPGKDGP